MRESPDYKKKAVFGFTTKGEDLFNWIELCIVFYNIIFLITVTCIAMYDKC